MPCYMVRFLSILAPVCFKYFNAPFTASLGNNPILKYMNHLSY
jgi:hypothetical protein